MLCCHSYFSLRFGVLSEEELLKNAAQRGYKTMALTDVNNTSACLSFVQLAPKYNIKPILGIDFRNGVQQEFVGLAKNNQGFQEINTFLSAHLHQKIDIPYLAPEFENVAVIYPFQKINQSNKTFQLKPYEYIGISMKELNQLRFSPYNKYKQQLVIFEPVTFRNKADFNTHRLLRAIGNNILLSKQTPDHHLPESIFYTKSEVLKAFCQYPQIINNTKELIESCTIEFLFGKNRQNQNLKNYTNSSEQDILKLRQLTQDGLLKRYSIVTETIKARIDKELKLIEQMNFVSFFLINWDIIQYAKSKGYYHVGRGSGANSIVAYLLGITDVDPIDLDLYFERFMNLFRANPPDFDIDFSSNERDDIINYIFKRFGKKNQAAMLATYNTFKYSASVREIGKVLGLPKHEIDWLSRAKYNPESLDRMHNLVLQYAHKIQDMPNILSVHPGGIIISDRSLHYFTATNLAQKNYPTTQFDMVVAEDVGLFKFDILGQRGLGKIRDTLTIIKLNRPNAPNIDIRNVQGILKDKNVNNMISNADCVGCFYVESPAMRMLFEKLEVDNYLALVAASSIIRPGVSQSGMMREYILRHKNPERRKNAHPQLLALMKDTYGVMVYQEDVIKVAYHFAGLSLSEADVLRRGMSGKYRSRAEFLSIKDKFFDNCRIKGHSNKLIQDVWSQIESFAGYAFAKGHSASFAVESYQSLYLKHYFPLEYMVAVLNNGGGFYSAELYIHEARMKGGIVHAPHINKSFGFTCIYDKDIYLGFAFLHELNQETIKNIVLERSTNGSFQSFNDFINRVEISISQVEILVRIGAFDCFGTPKKEVLWQAYFLLQGKPKNNQQQLFKIEHKQFVLPSLISSKIENAFDEMELLGFPLCSPFELLKNELPSKLLVKDLERYINKTVAIAAYFVSRKRSTTSNGLQMYFGTFIDRHGAWVDTVHFPAVAHQWPFRGKGIYLIVGKVMEEFSYLCIDVYKMERLEYVNRSDG